MCAAVMASRKAAMRAERRSAIGGHRQTLHQNAKRQLIPVRPEPANHRPCDHSQSGATALRLARVVFGEMDFDEGNLYPGQCIADGEAGVAVCTRIHECAIGPSTQRVHCFDDLSLSIVLRKREIDAKLSGDGQKMRLDVGQRFCPIELRLTRAEQVEIWSIDDGDSHSPVSPSSQARNFATSSSV